MGMPMATAQDKASTKHAQSHSMPMATAQDKDSTKPAQSLSMPMATAQDKASLKELDAHARRSPRPVSPRLSARRVRSSSQLDADAPARRSERPRNARRERCSVSPERPPS